VSGVFALRRRKRREIRLRFREGLLGMLTEFDRGAWGEKGGNVKWFGGISEGGGGCWGGGGGGGGGFVFGGWDLCDRRIFKIACCHVEFSGEVVGGTATRPGRAGSLLRGGGEASVKF